MKALRWFTVRAHLPERLAALEQLSTNLRWSWDKPTQDLFEAIDPTLWSQCGRDPVALLGAVSPAQLDELAALGAVQAGHPNAPTWCVMAVPICRTRSNSLPIGAKIRSCSRRYAAAARGPGGSA